jgi:hypothetical protein
MARQFSSSGGYASLAAVPSGDLLTLAAWFLNTGSPSANSTIVGLGNNSTSVEYLGLGLTDTSGSYSFNGFVGNGIEIDTNLSVTLTGNAWHLGVVTFNLSTTIMVCYTDGGNSTSKNFSAAGPPSSLTTATLAGLLNGSSTPISRPSTSVWIGEAAIWTVLLTAKEIADMYYSRRPVGGYRANALWAYWPLRGQRGGIEQDLSGFGRHISLIGNPLVAPHPPVYLPRNPVRMANQALVIPTPPLPRQVLRPLTPHALYDRWDYFP